MLVLSRQVNQSIMVGDVEIMVIQIRGNKKVRLGITAPDSVPVHRKEVYEAIRRGLPPVTEAAPAPTGINITTPWNLHQGYCDDRGWTDVTDQERGLKWHYARRVIARGETILATAEACNARECGAGGWPLPTTLEELDAVANLMIAAPKLLAACQEASKALRSYQHGNSATALAEEVADAVDAAIAEAMEDAK